MPPNLQTDVAVSGYDPGITDGRHDPPGQGGIQAKPPDHAPVERLPPTFWQPIALDLGAVAGFRSPRLAPARPWRPLASPPEVGADSVRDDLRYGSAGIEPTIL